MRVVQRPEPVTFFENFYIRRRRTDGGPARLQGRGDRLGSTALLRRFPRSTAATAPRRGLKLFLVYHIASALYITCGNRVMLVKRNDATA